MGMPASEYKVSLGMMKVFENYSDSCKTGRILKTVELFTLNGTF